MPRSRGRRAGPRRDPARGRGRRPTRRGVFHTSSGGRAAGRMCRGRGRPSRGSLRRFSSPALAHRATGYSVTSYVTYENDVALMTLMRSRARGCGRHSHPDHGGRGEAGARRVPGAIKPSGYSNARMVLNSNRRTSINMSKPGCRHILSYVDLLRSCRPLPQITCRKATRGNGTDTEIATERGPVSRTAIAQEPTSSCPTAAAR